MVMKDFLLLPLWVRASILLAVPLLLWIVLEKALLWILSLIPFLLRKFFRLFYRLLEIPVTVLHRKAGGSFYKLDNGLAQTGEKIDALLCKWYQSWHDSKKGYRGIAVFIYLACVVLIGMPSLLKMKSYFFDSVVMAYISCEGALIEWIEEQGWYDFQVTTTTWEEGEEGEEREIPDAGYDEITLIVSGVNSSLLVREFPTMETEIILDRVYDGEQVIWNGQLAFSVDENGMVEIWAKITTSSGIDGWSRISYLRPESYETADYFVTEKEKQ